MDKDETRRKDRANGSVKVRVIVKDERGKEGRKRMTDKEGKMATRERGKAGG